MHNQNYVQLITSFVILFVTFTCYGIYLNINKGYGFSEIIASIITILVMMIGVGIVAGILFIGLMFLSRLFKHN
jgi:hypothetical protein